MVEKGFELSEALQHAGDAGAAHPRLPHVRQFSPRTTWRAAHLGQEPPRRPPRFNYDRLAIRRSPSARRAQGRRAPAGGAEVHRRAASSTSVIPGDRRHRHHRAGRALQRADGARSRWPASPTRTAPRACRRWCSTSCIRWCRRRSRASAPASTPCWWSRKARPISSSRRSADLRKADLQTRLLGKDCCRWPASTRLGGRCKGLAAFLARRDGPSASTPTRSRLAERHAARTRPRPSQALGDIAGAAADFLHRLPGAAGVLRHEAAAARDSGRCTSRADIGCHSFATFAPFSQGNSILGYGMSLASAAAVGPSRTAARSP